MGPGEEAAARAAEGAIGEPALPQTDQKKASTMPRVVAEPVRKDLSAAAVWAESSVVEEGPEQMDPSVAAVRAEGAVEEGRAQIDSSAAAMMVEDAVGVVETGLGQTDSWMAEVMGEVSVVAAEEPMPY